MDAQAEIKQELQTLTEIKSEYQEATDLHRETIFVSTHSEKESTNSSETDCNGMQSNMEIKEEPCWSESMSHETINVTELPAAVLQTEEGTATHTDGITGTRASVQTSSYRRTSKSRIRVRGIWNQESMRRALEHVVAGKLALRDAAKRFGVPKSSLHDRVRRIRNGVDMNLLPKLGRFRPTFLGMEEKLVQYIQELNDHLMPLTQKEFLKVAYDLAEKLKLEHRFNKDKKIAGKHFYKSFMERHPELALCIPESTSVHNEGFSKLQVEHFYSKLEGLMKRHGFPPSRIYNMDEIELSCVHTNQNVLITKEKWQLTDAEREKHINVVFAMSAIGHFMPPVFVFPCKKMNPRLMQGTPEESVGFAQENGWMNGETFLQWLKYFVKHVLPCEDVPVLLILDGHGSHKELEVVLFARKHKIHMLSLPPETSHKLQPLERTFMKPFKDCALEEMSLWTRQNVGQRIDVSDMAGIASAAFNKVCSIDIAKNGFACTGIYPFNSNIFSDLDFLPCQVKEASENQLPVPSLSSEITTVSVEDCDQARNQNSLCVKSASEVPNMKHSESATRVSDAVHKLSPLQGTHKRRLASRKRKSQKSEILNSIPVKHMLIVKTKNHKQEEKKQKCIKYLSKKTVNSSYQATASSSKCGRACLVCRRDFDWIQCSSCEGWVHKECADIDPSNPYYTCDMCAFKNETRKT